MSGRVRLIFQITVGTTPEDLEDGSFEQSCRYQGTQVRGYPPVLLLGVSRSCGLDDDGQFVEEIFLDDDAPPADCDVLASDNTRDDQAVKGASKPSHAWPKLTFMGLKDVHPLPCFAKAIKCPGS